MIKFTHASQIVIKIGSSLITDQARGTVRAAWLKTLIADAVSLVNEGKRVVIVSSGSVALGKHSIAHARSPLTLAEKQAAAACGQIELMRHYQTYFRQAKQQVAQVLLTVHDSDYRRHYLNAKNTIETLLNNGIIPVINENDTVATEELRFGDNDRLAARVAQMIGADLLLIFSDVDGLYEANPQLDPNAQHIPLVTAITDDIQKMAGGAVSGVGSGGMATKIEAARIATSNGCSVIISKGAIKHPIRTLSEGGKHTLFTSSETPMSAKKRWLYNSLNITGEVIIDEGAHKALSNGKSLLPAGVTQVKGTFERGDAVIIRSHDHTEVGRGLVAYSATETKRIMGRKSTEIEHIIGFSGCDELIHRDNMAIKTGGGS